jgi:hypothetical protein
VGRSFGYLGIIEPYGFCAREELMLLIWSWVSSSRFEPSRIQTFQLSLGRWVPQKVPRTSGGSKVHFETSKKTKECQRYM